MSSRRSFLKQSCALCSAALGVSALLPEAGCFSGTHVYKCREMNGRLNIPIQAFRKKELLLVRAPSLHFDLLLVNKPGSGIRALLMKCTHKGEALELKKNFIYCSAHGSAFDFEGRVLSIPANLPLNHFPITQEGNTFVIRLKND